MKELPVLYKRKEECCGCTACYRFRPVLKARLILLDFADHLIYYTRKKVTYELLTHEYNYWRWAYESILLS